MKTLLIPSLLAAGLLSSASAATILIDFGTNPTSGQSDTWNNVTSYSVGQKSTDLRTTVNSSTNYSLSITQSGFAGGTDDGPVTLTPTSAFRDGYYGAFQTGTTDAPSIIRLSGLDPSLTYTFTFFGSVSRSGTRGARYTVGSQFAELETANNASTWSAPISGTPDSSGNLDIVISRASFNTDQSYLLNVVRIDFIPEPTTALLSVLGIVPLLRRKR